MLRTMDDLRAATTTHKWTIEYRDCPLPEGVAHGDFMGLIGKYRCYFEAAGDAEYVTFIIIDNKRPTGVPGRIKFKLVKK